MNFYEKDSYNESDLEYLFSNQIEESINLDYKRGDALSRNEKSKKEIGKDVASFANSTGGLIIYGIEEENHIPKNYVHVNGKDITKEWIEHVIQTRVHRKINGLIIHPVRIGGDVKKTVYIVQIPVSSNAPHMSSDNRYYRRYNFESVPMEEYEVRNLYLKIRQTTLEIDYPRINFSNGKTYSYKRLVSGSYKFWFHAVNTGGVLEKDFKLEIDAPKKIINNTLVKNNDSLICLNNKVKFSYPDSQILSLAGNQTIFPDEQYQFGYMNIKIKDVRSDENLRIGLKLYFSGGIVQKIWSIKEIFEYHIENKR